VNEGERSGPGDATPTFAVVGAVNHGKSSVVSTLAEDDQVRISAMPGETVECRRFYLLDLFVFYDTPGFQNAREALPRLAPAAQARDPLSVFREFVAAERGRGEFEAECILLEPILDGAGILYVVDGSEPVLEIHAAEMEILRLTGRPRLAIINRTRQREPGSAAQEDDHAAEWRSRLGMHFNAVREFDAHRATFADRLELLETLAGIEQAWKPKLLRAVAVFREDWERRVEECAGIMVELLDDSLPMSLAAAMPESSAKRDALAEDLKRRFVAAHAARERKAHQAIIRLFGHSRVKAGDDATLPFDAGLFSDETWQAFGLDESQLALAGAIGGAAAGAGIDVLTAGHTLLAGTIVGGIVGAAGAFLFGKQRPELKVDMPGIFGDVLGELSLGGSMLKVGPYTATNFPWILLDRAIGVFAYVSGRAHARRDEATIDTAALKQALDAAKLSTATWSEADRRACEKTFAAMRAGSAGSAERMALTEIVAANLARVDPSNL
jgi:hypothetical protein